MNTYRQELTKHIPDLWKYSLMLSTNQGDAHDLLYATIDQALHKQWKKPKTTPLYTWLSRIMYSQHLRGPHRGELRALQMPVIPAILREQHPISVH